MPEKEISEDDLKNMSSEEIAELQKQNCIFCKIASKEIPAKIVHEDADTICVLDINPASEGHILVYPKKHYMIMPHIPDDILAKVFKSVKLMSHTLLKTLQCNGTTVFVANGVAAGQKAPHVLIHVFPRRENDGLVKLPKYEMSDEQIEKLKKELENYTGQVFGRRKRIVKEAEFTDKKPEEDKVESQDNQEPEISERKEKHHEEHKEHKMETAHDKKHDEQSTKSPAKKDSKGSKVDLDDIAKLFGG
jgi:histidine triad (HIT) family protein